MNRLTIEFSSIQTTQRSEITEIVVITSPDTDIFVSPLYHFCKLNYCWFRFRLSEVLPAIHTLTGSDTATKVGTKSSAIRAGADCYHLMYSFGRDSLSDKLITDAEKFLLKCITKHDVDTFDELRFIVYHDKYSKFDIEHFPQTSTHNIKDSIYLQCCVCLHSAFL